MKHLSPLAHFEKPQDSQSLGFRSSFLSRTKPPSIATILPCESRKNFPIVDDVFEVFSSLIISNVVGNVIAGCCMQMRYSIHHRILVLYCRYRFFRLQSFSALSPLRLKSYGVSRRKWKYKFFCWLMYGFFISWWLKKVSLYVRVEWRLLSIIFFVLAGTIDCDCCGSIVQWYRFGCWVVGVMVDLKHKTWKSMCYFLLSDRSLVGKNFD